MSELADNTIEEPAVSPELPLPGAQLRAAREAHGISLAEVSQVLKFSVRQLEALEGDDYSNLQGTTFIRGFVRSYARYLRQDEAVLLAALEPRAPLAVSEVHPVESMGATMPEPGADGSKRTYWLAFAVLLLAGLAWFVWQGQSLSKPGSEVEIAAPAPEAPAPEAAPTAESLQPPAAVTLPEPLTPASYTSASPVNASPPVVEDAPAVIPPASAAAPNANERQLAFSFKGISWVEVRDVADRILFSGNSVPDTRQLVRGRPPFQLVIGNAQSVKLRYEDREIDLVPYTRVDVARLTLDDNTK